MMNKIYLFFEIKMSAYHIHFGTHKHKKKLFLVYSVIPILPHYSLKTIFMFMIALQLKLPETV